MDEEGLAIDREVRSVAALVGLLTVVTEELLEETVGGAGADGRLDFSKRVDLESEATTEEGVVGEEDKKQDG